MLTESRPNVTGESLQKYQGAGIDRRPEDIGKKQNNNREYFGLFQVESQRQTDEESMNWYLCMPVLYFYFMLAVELDEINADVCIPF